MYVKILSHCIYAITHYAIATLGKEGRKKNIYIILPLCEGGKREAEEIKRKVQNMAKCKGKRHSLLGL